MNRKKTIFTAVVLLLILIIGGILAYFTDTEERTNVFTIGNVDISLAENAEWTAVEGHAGQYEYTKVVGSSTISSRAVKPGAVIDKCPTITNEGSEDAYVFMKIQVPVANVSVGGAAAATQELYNLTFDDTPANGYADDWTLVSHDAATGTYVFVYGTGTSIKEYSYSTGLVPLASGATTSDLLKTVELKDVRDASSLPSTAGALDIIITAYAIQTNPLDVPEGAGTDAAKIFAMF